MKPLDLSTATDAEIRAHLSRGIAEAPLENEIGTPEGKQELTLRLVMMIAEDMNNAINALHQVEKLLVTMQVVSEVRLDFRRAATFVPVLSREVGRQIAVSLRAVGAHIPDSLLEVEREFN